MTDCDKRAAGALKDVPNTEELAKLCGEDLGKYDKERGVFDPKPPCGVGGAFAVIYKKAYLKANPKS